VITFERNFVIPIFSNKQNIKHKTLGIDESYLKIENRKFHFSFNIFNDVNWIIHFLIILRQSACQLLHDESRRNIKSSERLHLSLCKAKLKLSLCFNWVQRYETYWRSGWIVPLILDLGTSWWRVVSFTPWPLYSQGDPSTHCIGGWVGIRAVILLLHLPGIQFNRKEGKESINEQGALVYFRIWKIYFIRRREILISSW